MGDISNKKNINSLGSISNINNISNIRNISNIGNAGNTSSASSSSSSISISNISGKKCLMVIHRFWPFLGGSERQFLKWAEILDENNCAVDVFTTNVWDNDYFYFPEKKYIKENIVKIGKKILIKRFKVSHLPNKNAALTFFSKLPFKFIKFLIGVPYIFLPGYYFYMFFITFFLPKKFNFIIAGVFPHYYLIYPAYIYAKVKKIPFILVPLVHFGQPNSDENFELFFNDKAKYLLKNSDYILTITNEEKEKLTNFGIESSKIRVSGIGVDERLQNFKIIDTSENEKEIKDENSKNYYSSIDAKILEEDAIAAKAAKEKVIAAEKEAKSVAKETAEAELIGAELATKEEEAAAEEAEAEEAEASQGKKFKSKYNIESPFILQISTQTHDKGSHHTIEAMKILWQKGIDVKLVLIGQILSEFEQYLINQKSYVFENTIILNYASEEDKNNAIMECDAFVMPSKSDSFGVVFVEAWLYEKPVIAAYCSGVTELIDEGINGYFVPFGDYEMLAGYILKLLKNKELASKMGKEGRKKALNEYLWEQRLKGFIKLIGSLKI